MDTQYVCITVLFSILLASPLAIRVQRCAERDRKDNKSRWDEEGDNPTPTPSPEKLLALKLAPFGQHGHPDTRI